MGNTYLLFPNSNLRYAILARVKSNEVPALALK